VSALAAVAGVLGLIAAFGVAGARRRPRPAAFESLESPWCSGAEEGFAAPRSQWGMGAE